jgi:hypothetical protein
MSDSFEADKLDILSKNEYDLLCFWKDSFLSLFILIKKAGNNARSIFMIDVFLRNQ